VGQPARVYGPGCCGHGLGPRYRRPSTTRARARVVRVFSHAQVILNLRTTSRNGGSLSDCSSSSTLSVAFDQHFLHGDFGIALSFTFSRPPPTTFPHGDIWGPARRRLGWVRQEVVYCYTAGMFLIFSFLFFFWLASSFAAKSPHSILSSLPTDTTGFSLEGPPGPTTDRDNGDDA
jgi:hypothetical protein